MHWIAIIALACFLLDIAVTGCTNRVSLFQIVFSSRRAIEEPRSITMRISFLMAFLWSMIPILASAADGSKSRYEIMARSSLEALAIKHTNVDFLLSLTNLPASVRQKLGNVADSGQPYADGCVGQPNRRFLAATKIRETYHVAFEQGGLIPTWSVWQFVVDATGEVIEDKVIEDRRIDAGGARNAAQPQIPSPEGIARYHSLAGSRVAIEGYSSIHDWRVEGNLIAGYLEVGLGFPQEALRGAQIKARAELFIPVKNLKAVGADSEQITAVMHRTLRAQEHPKIIFRLLGLTGTATEASTDMRRKFDATGELVIGGVTNTVSMPVMVEVLSGGALKIIANTKIRQSDFNLRPRRRMEGWVDEDTVKIQCEWRVAEKGEPK